MIKKLDQVILVNQQDEPIGVMDKTEAHRGMGRLHQAISVFLFRKNKTVIELLIQQRSQQKITCAGWWANTVCGNVRPDESREQCALRRLKEELGITKARIKPIYKFQYQAKCDKEFSENEIDQVFVGWFDGQIQPNPAEVADYQWINWPSLLDQKITQYQFVPWFGIMLCDLKLRKLIEKNL